jgi:hypothetical protein
MSEIHQWWRLWSVRLAAVAGAVSAALTAEPSILLGLINMLPQGPLRWVVAASVGILVFAVPTIARIKAQPKLGAGGQAAGGRGR